MPKTDSGIVAWHRNGNAVQAGKAALCYLVDHSGINAIARARNRESVLVLSYHGVIADEYGDHPVRLPTMVTVTEFRQQMNELRRLFNPVRIGDVRKWLRGSGTLPNYAVLVTFDDGYSNSLTHAAKVLLETRVPAIFFLPTGYIGDRRVLWPTEVYLRVYTWGKDRLPLPDGSEIDLSENQQIRTAIATAVEEMCKGLPSARVTQYLSEIRGRSTPWSVAEKFGKAGEEMFSFLGWDQVRELHRLGFDIGSHSVEHPILSRISTDHLVNELRHSKQTIENQLGTECYSFAYPNGGPQDFDSRTPSALVESGYDLGFTLMGHVCDRSLSAVMLDRVWIPGRDGLPGFRTRTSGVFLKLKRLTA